MAPTRAVGPVRHHRIEAMGCEDHRKGLLFTLEGAGSDGLC